MATHQVGKTIPFGIDQHALDALGIQSELVQSVAVEMNNDCFPVVKVKLIPEAPNYLSELFGGSEIVLVPKKEQK